MKISFSDFIKRKEVIGDLKGYTPSIENAKTLYMEYPAQTSIPSEERLKDLFARYGKVRAIYLKEQQANSYLRPCVFLDYFTHFDAQRALTQLQGEHNKGILGHPRVQIMYGFQKQTIIGKKTIDPATLCIYIYI